jgi:hypothetical protein
MNMGVDCFLFHHLKLPPIEPVGEVVYSLDNPQPDWIKLADNDPLEESLTPKKILFIGGCNAAQILYYLDKKNEIETFFSYLGRNDQGHPTTFNVRTESIDFLTYDLSPDQKEFICGTQPLFDREMIFKDYDYSKYDTVIYYSEIDASHSTLVTDDIPGFYLHQEPVHKPTGIFNELWKEQEKPDELLEAQLNKFYHICTQKAGKLIHILPISQIIEGHEEEKWHLRLVSNQKKYNELVSKIAAQYENVCIFELDSIFEGKEDLLSDPRHCSRPCLARIGAALNKLLS